jgi:DNA-binding XRE family transcriptional regulator
VSNSLKKFKAAALARPDVKRAYEALHDEFAYLDVVLGARHAAGMTQADVAQRMGTTQSAVARLETGAGKRAPSLHTLQRYAQAVGCRVELRLVADRRST